MKGNLLILGAGQYGVVAKETAEAMGCFEKIEYLDDMNQTAIGKLNEFSQFTDAFTMAVVAIGDPALRMKLLTDLQTEKYEVVALISPNAYIAPSALIQSGCIIEPMAVVQAQSVVEKGCIISAGAVVNHNSFIGEGCHINCNSTISARTVVPPNTILSEGQVFG